MDLFPTDQSSESDLSPLRQSASPSPIKVRKRPASSGKSSSARGRTGARGKQQQQRKGGHKQATKRQKMATAVPDESLGKEVIHHSVVGLSASSSSSDEDEFDRIMKDSNF